MINKILRTEDGRRVFQNFVSLGFLQGANYILPLMTFPYLIRVIGVEKFGLLSFALAMIGYFVIITDYGFNLTATKLISINRDNQNKINRIFSSVMIIKILLMIVSFVILCLIISFSQKLRSEMLVYIFSFGTVIGQVLFPVWFFQGMERMGFIMYLNILSKLIFTIAIFIFIKTQEDYYLVPLLTSAGYIFAGLSSLHIVRWRFQVRFTLQPLRILKYFLYDGWHLFVTSIFSSFYRNTNIIILGFFTNDIFVGYYSIAEKIIKLIQSLQDVIGRALFPYFAKKFNNNTKLFFQIMRKSAKYIFICYFLLTSITFLFSGIIIKLITGEYDLQLMLNLRIMSFIIFFGGISYFFGVLGLVILNYKKDFSTYIIRTGVISILTCTVGAYFYNDIGVSLAFLFSELFLFIQICYKINQIRKKTII